MKSASAELVSILNGAQTGDAQLIFADAYQFTLANGAVLGYTNSQITFTYGGTTYLGNNVLIDGLKYKAAVGLDVDQQQITVAARSGDTVGGVPFLQALRNGAFDGCEIIRYRIFFSTELSQDLYSLGDLYQYSDLYTAGYIAGGTPVGAVLLFKGRLGNVDKIGRTVATLTVNSDLILLDVDMPRNLYQPTCLHTLYDSGCTLSQASFTSTGSVGSGSTASIINWSSATANFQQGTITFTSGVNDGVSATVGAATSGVLTLIYPLQSAPSTGDTFTVSYGCDHTPGTCKSKFNNLTNFRGFPYVPPPQMAI